MVVVGGSAGGAWRVGGGEGKRKDSGCPAEGDARAYLGTGPVGDRFDSPWNADALTVNPYLGSDGIAPFFNILAYHSFGYAVSRALLNFFYRVSAEYVSPAAAAELPRDSIVIYLMNHRSNADYVLVGYVLSGRVAISYAVGEWARIWPLQQLIRSMGAYFVRRNSNSPIYRRVLERYVHMATEAGVAQAMYPEGGLSRDGRLRHRSATVTALTTLSGAGSEALARSHWQAASNA